MEQQTDQERWEDFRDRALVAVRKGHEPDFASNRRFECVLQIIHNPSFDTVVGWQLFKERIDPPNTSTTFIATRTAWLQEMDMDKFAAPKDQVTMMRLKYLHRLAPALTFHSIEADHMVVERLISRLFGLRVPLYIQDRIFGCDGDSFELTIGDFWAGVTFQWWEKCPKEWQELGEVTMLLLTHLEERHLEQLQL